jgi:sulfur-oxidizing protein SoxX
MGHFRRRILPGLGTAIVLANCFSSVYAQTLAIDGRKLFLDTHKGGCAACHPVPGDPSITVRARIGPDLAGIKARYPDRAQLRAVIWDLSGRLPGTIMPPYGKHRILTETEIDAIVRYLEML